MRTEKTKRIKYLRMVRGGGGEGWMICLGEKKEVRQGVRSAFCGSH